MATDLSLEKWQLAFDTQARAFFICARTAAKFIGGGRIIWDVLFTEWADGCWQPWVGMESAKAAMDSISRHFAVALGRCGITVNTVSPGMSDAGVMEQTATVSGCNKGMGSVGMDAYATARHSEGYCGCLGWPHFVENEQQIHALQRQASKGSGCYIRCDRELIDPMDPTLMIANN